MRNLKKLLNEALGRNGDRPTIHRVEVYPFEFATFEDQAQTGDRRLNVGVYNLARRGKTVPLDRLLLLPRATFEAFGRLAKEEWVPSELRLKFQAAYLEGQRFAAWHIDRAKDGEASGTVEGKVSTVR